MLKYIFMVMFFMIFLFYKKINWMVQNFIFFLFFIVFINMKFNLFSLNLSYFLGVDVISCGMILLSIWISGLMLMASEGAYKYNLNYFMFSFLILLLLLILIISFSVLDLFMYYLFFESSLIPTFFLILGWGFQPERMQAGYYLLFYTLLASLPLLLVIFYCKHSIGSISYMFMNKNFSQFYVYLFMILAFLVKMPMFFVHLWLPKAHVEAPISGSMILAGVLLKLGGYGLLRVFVLIQSVSMKYNLCWYMISLLGSVFISLVCLCQVDTKSLIAYSSVSHMGLVIAGLMTMSVWGYLGSYVLMIGHGLCSSGLFCLLNVVYERSGSRSLFINKGLLNFMPSMSLWWFLLSSSNMAAPPSLNLLGEIMLLNSVISWSYVSMFLLMIFSFFSAAYSLYMFSISQHGQIYSLKYSFSMNSCREYLLMFLHWFPLNLLILKPDLFVLWI